MAPHGIEMKSRRAQDLVEVGEATPDRPWPAVPVGRDPC